MSRRLRLRWYGGDGEPMIGRYLIPTGARSRAAYLILACDDRGPRGGLGRPVYELFVLTLERVSRAEATAADPLAFQWDKRPRKRRALRLSELPIDRREGGA